MTESTDQLVITPKKSIQIVDEKSKIVIQNNSLSGYAYKVRTTHPDAYSVKPNIGIIKPLDTVKISIAVQKNDKNEDPQKAQAKFNLLIYEYDHKRTLDDFKKYLNDIKPVHLLSRILPVNHEKRDPVNEKSETEKLAIFVLAAGVVLWIIPSIMKNLLTL